MFWVLFLAFLVILYNKDNMKLADWKCDIIVFSEFWLINLHIKSKNILFSMGGIFPITYLSGFLSVGLCVAEVNLEFLLFFF